MSLFDRLVFLLANLAIYVRFPLLALRFRWRQGRWANFAAPANYADLVQWRKVFDRNPLFPVFSDKLAAKDWIADRCPDIAIPETVWVGERCEDVPDRFLSPDYVIKLNNESSSNYFPHRHGTARGDFEQAARTWYANPFWKWLRKASRGEWGYIPVQPRVLVEKRILTDQLVDISVRACDGKALVVSCATEFKTGRDRLGFFWPDGTSIKLPNRTKRKDLDADFQLPSRFREAIRFSEEISRGFDYLRVDFMAGDDQLLAGEITLYPASGFGTEELRTELVYRCWLEAIHLSWPLRTPQPWWRRPYIEAFKRWVARRQQVLGSAHGFLAQVQAGAFAESEA